MYIYNVYIYIYIYICVCLCVCVCVCVPDLRHRNTVIFDTRKTLNLKEPPVKLLEIYLTDNGIYLIVI